MPDPCYQHSAHSLLHNPGPSREPISIPQGKGQGHLSRKKTVTIPSGSILAFQVAQLVIGSDWGELGLGGILGPSLCGRDQEAWKGPLVGWGCCRHLAAQLPGSGPMLWHMGSWGTLGNTWGTVRGSLSG